MAEAREEGYYFRLYKPNPANPVAVIVDLDGTIAHGYHRGFYEWDRVDGDEPDERMRFLLNTLSAGNPFILFLYVSGRDESCRKLTEKWISRNDFPLGPIFLRPPGDTRSDVIVKYELFDRFIRNEYNILCVFDDRNKVVNMWRSIGLKCLQVQEGDF